MAREYKQAYNKAKQELLEHLKKRDQLDQEIRKLKQSTKTLAELAGADPEEVDKLLLTEGFAIDPRLGFTDAIRRNRHHAWEQASHPCRSSPRQLRFDSWTRIPARTSFGGGMRER